MDAESLFSTRPVWTRMLWAMLLHHVGAGLLKAFSSVAWIHVEISINAGFPYKPTILGYSHLWKPPCRCHQACKKLCPSGGSCARSRDVVTEWPYIYFWGGGVTRVGGGGGGNYLTQLTLELAHTWCYAVISSLALSHTHTLDAATL